MCDFYSFLTDKKGNRYAFTREMRKAVINGGSDLRIDSHASIAEHYFGNSRKEDECNKYEFNPLTKELKLEQMNLEFDDSELININELLEEVKLAVPELIIKPIIHPLKDVKFDEVITDDIVNLIREWASLLVSMGASMGASLWDSVMDSVMDSVGVSVGVSVRDSVRVSVRASLLVSVGASVLDSVWDSVWASMGAYISSFFNIEKWEHITNEPFINPFQPCINLWEMGLVPSYDGKVWRLHSYKGIVWTGRLND